MTAPSEGQPAEDHQGLDAQEDWVPEFKPNSGGIDGVLTVAGDSLESIDKMIQKTFDWVFNSGNDKQSIEKLYSRDGKVYENHREQSVLPSSSEIDATANIYGHSFGWVDGISQPIIKGLDDISDEQNARGMKPIDPG
jgi:hypothetical protein